MMVGVFDAPSENPSVRLSRPEAKSMRSLQDQIREFADVLREHGEDVDAEHLIACSGAAFRSYEFVADDNYNWATTAKERDWRYESLDVDNYGAFEALAVHTGWARRVWSVQKLPDLLGLIRSERDEGRKPLRYVGSETERVLGIHREGFDLSLLIESLDGVARSEMLGSIKDPKGFLARVGVLVTVRPEVVDSQERRRAAILHDMLRWIPRHHGCVKEIAYEKDCYFASGRRATLSFAQSLLRTGSSQRVDDYQRRWLDEFTLGRLAACTFWDGELPPKWITDQPLASIRDEAQMIRKTIEEDLRPALSDTTAEVEPIRLADALLAVVAAEDRIIAELQSSLVTT